MSLSEKYIPGIEIPHKAFSKRQSHLLRKSNEIYIMLSICIPTYNNAEALDKTLLSIVSQDEFRNSNKVEVVISDNNSSDGTARIAKKYISQFNEKVKYYKNKTNVEDKNFELALSRGTKEFLKLANDSLNWRPNAINHILEVLEGAANEKPQIIFTNANIEGAEFDVISTLDELVEKASYFVTWIGSFSLWRNDFELVRGFSANSHNHLTQVEALFRLVKYKKLALINNKSLWSIIPRGPKGYNMGVIFGDNYISILKDPQNQISNHVFESEKRKVLEKHLLPLYYDDVHNFNRENIRDELKIFESENYFLPFLNSFNEQYIRARSKRSFHSWQNIWRMRNPNNEISISNLFNFRNVTIGDYSYGPIRVMDWGADNEGLVIGRFVSISSGVTFILGGNHPHSGITTFPVKVKFLNHSVEAKSKGLIEIGDDVWIGTNSTILSGVKIGQGAVVGAESVVSKDVPPYAIVAGNPARVVKYRFEQSTIQQMLQVDYRKILKSDLIELGERLYGYEGEKSFQSCLDHLREISKTI